MKEPQLSNYGMTPCFIGTSQNDRRNRPNLKKPGQKKIDPFESPENKHHNSSFNTIVKRNSTLRRVRNPGKRVIDMP